MPSNFRSSAVCVLERSENMIILPCLEFVLHGGYMTYVFLLMFVFGLMFRLMGVSK